MNRDCKLTNAGLSPLIHMIHAFNYSIFFCNLRFSKSEASFYNITKEDKDYQYKPRVPSLDIFSLSLQRFGFVFRLPDYSYHTSLFLFLQVFIIRMLSQLFLNYFPLVNQRLYLFLKLFPFLLVLDHFSDTFLQILEPSLCCQPLLPLSDLFVFCLRVQKLQCEMAV